MRGLAFVTCAFIATGAAAQQGLSAAEQQGFAAQVARCWNVVALSGTAQPAIVTVQFALDRRGKPLGDSFVLVGAGKDTSEAVKSAYDAAKRAILRCGAKGYELPLEKYDHWRNIELTFNPERMSLR